MSLLSSTGKIFLIKEPVCGRFGMHKLLAQLSSGVFKVGWDGQEEITIVTFNRRRTICSILHIDPCGVDRMTRMLNTGTFQVILDAGLLPERLTRRALELLLSNGSIHMPLRSEQAESYLKEVGLLHE